MKNEFSLNKLLLLFLFFVLFWAPYIQAKKSKSGFEFNSKIGFETRLFQDSALDSRQHGNNLSIWFETEIFKEWKNKKLSLTITPFFRIDENDKERTHGDLRDFMLHKTSRKWELKIGIGKVFWGVTESQHLVDIINQTDSVESTDGEDKLGQPMVHLILKPQASTIDLFILPYFRERTFAGLNGRLRSNAYVDTDLTQYESSKKEKQIDYAFRWSRTIKIWDIGLSYFSGTSRSPNFIPTVNGAGDNVLIPRYELIDQTGLDLQATIGKWLWKLEAIKRRSNSASYSALTTGFEYTLSGFRKSKADLGLLVEYLYDDRENPALTPFDNDVLLASRVAFNDPASSELLFGFIIDLNNEEKAYFFEFSRRLKQSFKLSIEGRFSSNTKPTSVLYSQRNNNYVQLELVKYF